MTDGYRVSKRNLSLEVILGDADDGRIYFMVIKDLQPLFRWENCRNQNPSKAQKLTGELRNGQQNFGLRCIDLHPDGLS